MARKKKSETTKTDRKQRAEMLTNDLRNRFSNLSISRSYTSLAYGIITLIVLFALGFAAVRLITQDSTPEISDNGVDTANQDQEDIYVVQEGDTLWSIAESEYNDGYAWSEIAEVNTLADPNNLEAGTELTLPDRENPEMANDEMQATASPVMEQEEAIEEPSPSPTAMPQSEQTQTTGERITGSEYTVVAGDTLWDISVRAYNDGYRWTEIAQANGITYPDLIFVGTKLNLQR